MRFIIYILFLLLICGISGCRKSNASGPNTPDKELFSQEEIRLRKKADEAFVFCKTNHFDTTYCLLIDMKIHSGKNRIFVWDFNKQTVSHEGLCCHGKGGGSTGSKPVFSNKNGSNCTSLGKYRIGDRSFSKWGIHVHYKLHGLEETNDKAFERIVVLHSFKYVPDNEIYPFHLPTGFSLGCPVISDELMTRLDKRLQKKEKPVLLWIYY